MTLDQAKKKSFPANVLMATQENYNQAESSTKSKRCNLWFFDANEYKELRDTKQITKGIYPQKEIYYLAEPIHGNM